MAVWRIRFADAFCMGSAQHSTQHTTVRIFSQRVVISFSRILRFRERLDSRTGQRQWLELLRRPSTGQCVVWMKLWKRVPPPFLPFPFTLVSFLLLECLRLFASLTFPPLGILRTRRLNKRRVKYSGQLHVLLWCCATILFQPHHQQRLVASGFCTSSVLWENLSRFYQVSESHIHPIWGPGIDGFAYNTEKTIG